MSAPDEPAYVPPAIQLLALGAFTGIMSGLFGVGGGFIVVPALLLMGVNQRMAAGISVAAILPTSLVGAVGYTALHQVDWFAAVILAVGMIVGAQIGVRLLHKISERALFWAFAAMLVAVIPSLWLVIPSRGDTISIDVLTGLLLALTGILVGILSAMLGVGGGILVVPALILFFGAGDLVAKGTSLVMMIPGAISATISNFRRSNVHLRAAAYVGIVAAAISPLGIWLATFITPLQSNIGFSLLLAFTLEELIRKRFKKKDK